MKATLLTICVLLMLAPNASALLMDVHFEDLPEQDPMPFGPQLVHELGTGALFPHEELIQAGDDITDQTACPDPPGDNPAIPNALVYMTNLTPTKWTDVWYVADGIDPFVPAETSLTNYDGLVNGALAFKIDYYGINRSLVFEDMNPDGIFEPGETWAFIIQDYQNVFGLAPSMLGSPGVPSPGEQFMSSGSIIAIPEPATLALLGAGVLLLRRRRQ